MKKIVCAGCGLVNLDKFVSFPHCAACGSLLPQAAPSRWRTVWRRPVRPFYWMLAVGSGLGMLGLAIASIARETKARGDKPLVVYAQMPRETVPAQSFIARFTLDSALEDPDDNFRRVSLRLGQDTRHAWGAIGIKPKPKFTEKRGRGFYYLWDELPRNSVIEVTLAARAGQKRGDVLPIHATLWAAEYQQFEVRANVEVNGKIDSAYANRAANNGRSRTQDPMQRAPEVAR